MADAGAAAPVEVSPEIGQNIGEPVGSPMQQAMQGATGAPGEAACGAMGEVAPMQHNEQNADAESDAAAMPTEDAGMMLAAVRQPQYNEDGTLQRPADAEEWVFMGSGVNFNYIAVKPGIVVDVLTVTLMEPTAYHYFKDTGTFAEGTMTALLAFLLDSGAPPAQHGQYPGELAAFEMSVKDSAAHGMDVWGYYDFGLGDAAPAKPASECNACHKENAQTDFVFTQFYPFMRQ